MLGEVSITGNIHCPYCGRWTVKNVEIDKPPYHCEWCGSEVEVRTQEEV